MCWGRIGRCGFAKELGVPEKLRPAGDPAGPLRVLATVELMWSKAPPPAERLSGLYPAEARGASGIRVGGGQAGAQACRRVGESRG